MFKSGDKVTFKGREESTRRLPRPGDKVKPGDEEDYIVEPGKQITIKGVIGRLDRFYIPVRLKDGSIRQILHKDLVISSKGVVTLKEKRPDRTRMVDHVETIVKGKSYTVKAKIDLRLRNLHIPVVVDGDERQIPFKNLKFKETK